MQTTNTIAKLKSILNPIRDQGKSIALVNTMGNLHEGHLKLITRAREIADYVVVTIFVNPLQFNSHEAFDTFPRPFKQDSLKLANANVDLLFAPSCEELFPNGLGQHTVVNIPELADELCGVSRPDYFRGIATTYNKLLNIVQPNALIIGEDDYQRVAILRKMVADLCLAIELITIPSVRDADNLVINFHNTYLTKAQHKLAPELFHTLKKIANEIKSGNRDYISLTESAVNNLEQLGFKSDYVSIRCRNDLQPANKDTKQLVIMAAAYLDKIRLIDNLHIDL